MPEHESSESLSLQTADYLASAVKAALGAVPLAGSLLVELVGTVIPNQRVDRIVRFARELEDRLSALEQDFVRSQVADQNFTDLIEEALRQAAQSVTDDRLRHLAALVANSLSQADVSYVESKHLLRILGEINDIEVIWLRFYLVPTIGGDQTFRQTHDAVLQPVEPSHVDHNAWSFRVFGLAQAELAKETLQQSYKDHLTQLGLLRSWHRSAVIADQPPFDGAPSRVSGYEVTPLGRLLSREIGLENIEGRAIPALDPTAVNSR